MLSGARFLPLPARPPRRVLVPGLAALLAVSFVGLNAQASPGGLPDTDLAIADRSLAGQTYAPLRSTYVDIPVEMATGRQPIFAPGGPALPIYLNRWGGTYTSGWDDSSANTSSIVQGSSASISPFSGTDGQWNEVLSCVQDQFAAYNVYVTDIEPTSGAYIEAVVAGSPGQLGMPNGVGGVAPFDPYQCSLIDTAIVFAFADVYMQGGWGGGTRALCETATQEIAHAMTLDHVLICEDPMTYLYGCGEKTFQDEYGSCGEQQPRECACGRPSQNSVQVLTEVLGLSDGTTPPPPPEDNAPPVVNLTSPEDGDVFMAETEIAITAEVTDDAGLTLVQLYWENNDILLPCPAQNGGYTCDVVGSTYTWRVAPGLGTRSFSVSARDIAGNVTESDLVTIILTEDGQAPPEDNLPPDVALVSPLAGAQLQSNSAITVIATASDDSGIAQMRLEWDYSDDVFGCPMSTQTVDCSIDGSTYTWSIRVGDGTRTFRAVARDMLGNESVTESRTITLVASPSAGPADDNFEDNDTWEQATSMACDDKLDLIAVAGDDDWFRLSVPADMGVRITVGGPLAEDLDISVRTGPFSGTELSEGTGAEVVELIPEQSEIGVRISASGETYGDYSLQVACVDASTLTPPEDAIDGTVVDSEGDSTDQDAPSPLRGFGCSASGGGDDEVPFGGLLALSTLTFACVRRRRR